MVPGLWEHAPHVPEDMLAHSLDPTYVAVVFAPDARGGIRIHEFRLVRPPQPLQVVRASALDAKPFAHAALRAMCPLHMCNSVLVHAHSGERFANRLTADRLH